MGLGFVYRDTQKFPIQFGLWGQGEFLKLFVAYLYCTKYNENNIFHNIFIDKNIFRLQDHTKDFRYIMGYTWKSTGYVS